MSSSTIAPSTAMPGGLPPPSPVVSVGKVIDYISFAAATLGGLLMLFLAAITNYEIFARFILGKPTTWTLEVSIYMLVWFSFLSLAYVQRIGRHIRVDLLTNHLGKQSKILWDLIGIVFSMIFIVVFSFFAYDFFWEALANKEVSPDMLAAPMWIPKLSLFIGSAVLILQLAKDFVWKIYELKAQKDKPLCGISGGALATAVVFLLAAVAFSWLYSVSPFGGLVCLMFLLLFGGVPIYAALGIVGMMGIGVAFGGFSAMNTLPNVAFGALSHFGLASLPLFIMAGQLLSNSGIGKELYDLCAKWLGNLPGGLAGATIVACAIFSAISISSVATAATIGIIAFPELAKRMYNKPFSYGTVAAGGTLGIMIPPSGTMIIYSAVTEESLGQLFMAGLLPGMLLAAAFFCYALIYCKATGNYQRMEPITIKEKFLAIKTGIWGLLAPTIILGGIYSGIFTPLEAGGVVVLYTFILIMVRRQLTFGGFINTLRDCCVNGGMLLIIISGALIMGNYMTLLQVPTKAVEFISGLGMSPWMVIVALMILYIILGMFLEVVSAMMITLPVVYPLITSLGFDGIWFAVVLTLNMEMACITPPVGLNLYVIQGLTKSPLIDVLKGVFPYVIVMVTILIVLIIFPDISTWLPSTMVRGR